MPGPVTVTSALAIVVVTKPGIVVETVVVPAATGSNATPPAATEAVCAAPTGNRRRSLRPPTPSGVLIKPTLGVLLVIVTVSALPPARIGCAIPVEVLIPQRRPIVGRHADIDGER